MQKVQNSMLTSPTGDNIEKWKIDWINGINGTIECWIKSHYIFALVCMKKITIMQMIYTGGKAFVNKYSNKASLTWPLKGHCSVNS